MNFEKFDNVKSFASRGDLYSETAAYIAARVGQSEKKFYLAVSGGSTPLPLYEILRDQHPEMKWDNIELFWVDERMVPPSDKESNYGNSAGFFSLIPPGNIHRVRGENDIMDEAVSYSNDILRLVPEVKSIPSFDLVLLGVGRDGHTASIFPWREVYEVSPIIGITSHPESGQGRITFTEVLINNAKEILFLVTGSEKRDTLYNILYKKDRELPAVRINGNVRWHIFLE